MTSGAAVCDTIGLFASAPDGLDPSIQLPNELGTGVCSVAEVVDWYGKVNKDDVIADMIQWMDARI